jgi:hypothetical protein
VSIFFMTSLVWVMENQGVITNRIGMFTLATELLPEGIIGKPGSTFLISYSVVLLWRALGHRTAEYSTQDFPEF